MPTYKRQRNRGGKSNNITKKITKKLQHAFGRDTSSTKRRKKKDLEDDKKKKRQKKKKRKNFKLS